MYLWNDEGMDNLLGQAENYARAAVQSAGRDYDSTLVERMNFFITRAESAFQRLLPELVEHSDPFWPPLPPRMDVPPVEEPTDAEAMQMAGSPPGRPERNDFRTLVREPGLLGRIFGGRRRYEEQVRRAAAADDEAFRRALQHHEAAVAEWRGEVDSAREAILRKREEARSAAEEYNRGIDEAEALRASPTPDYIERVATESVLRTFYPSMSNLSLPLPGPGYIRTSYAQAGREVLIGIRAPAPEALLPPGGFELDEAAGRPAPLAREESDRSRLYRTYAASLALGAANVVVDLIEDASLEKQVTRIGVDVFMEEDGQEPTQGRRRLVSLRARAEALRTVDASADDPTDTVERLGGRIAADPLAGPGIDPFPAPDRGEAEATTPREEGERGS